MEGRITRLVLDPPIGGPPQLSQAILDVSTSISKAMFRIGGHVVWCGNGSGAAELGNQINVSTCMFGTPWCGTKVFSSTWDGILGLETLCKDRCGLLGLEGGPSLNSQENAIWPLLADAIAKCVDGIKGIVVDPKCAHLAGFNAPMGGDSMLSCLERIGFKPSGGRAVSTVSSRVASCVQPSKRLAPTILPEGLGPVAHLAVALQTQHPFSRPPQLEPHVEFAISTQPQPGALSARRNRCCVVLSKLCKALQCEWDA